MTSRKEFWIGACALIGAVYVIAVVFAVQVGLSHRVVRLALIMLAVHAIELPLAFKRLAEQKPATARTVALTLLFGAAWWVPAQRRIFAVA